MFFLFIETISKMIHENKVIQIGMEAFEDLVRKEKSPLFLACVSEGIDYPEQIKSVTNINEKYCHLIKVCLLNPDDNENFGCRHGMDGTPTFYIFHNGREIDRFLGMADKKSLEGFVLSALVSGNK
jgi:thioredoxin-like negative regulator of GroEL